MRHVRVLLFLSLLLSLLANTGCGILIGNVKPVAQKSDRYRVMDLTKQLSPDWQKLENKPPEGEPAGSEDISDLTYQSKKTASIISLNSACRPRIQDEPQSLQAITNQLLLGFTDITLREEKSRTVDSNPALQTTVQGKLNGELTRLRTVVIHREDCIYDVMYIARPNHFATQETDFSRFVDSLRLR